MTIAYEGVGCVLTIDTVAVSADLIEVTMPEATREALDTSHLGISNGYKTSKPGKLADAGDWSFVFDYDDQADYQFDGLTHTYRLTLPLKTGEASAAYVEFTGYAISKGGVSLKIGEVGRLNMTVKQTGPQVITAGA